MIPSGIRRGSQGRANIPVWALAAGAVLALVVVFLAYVALTMGSAPAGSEVTSEVPVQL